jgi:hypothetical protein
VPATCPASSVDGDPVRWLWIVPITEGSRQFAKEHGSASLVSRMAYQGALLGRRAPSAVLH